MPQIEIYTTVFCAYCVFSKRLLKRKGLAYEEISLTFHPSRRREMIERAEGRYTTPQIFVDGVGIGGCDELYALDQTDELDVLLAGSVSLVC